MVNQIPLGAALLALVGLSSPNSARAQGAKGSPPNRHASICAAGVRTYSSEKEVPTPHDTLTLPPHQPVRVSSEEEVAAADLTIRGLAGSVGATGIVVTEVTSNSGGAMVVQRHVTPVFVPSDSVRAHAACKT